MDRQLCDEIGQGVAKFGQEVAKWRPAIKIVYLPEPAACAQARWNDRIDLNKFRVAVDRAHGGLCYQDVETGRQFADTHALCRYFIHLLQIYQRQERATQ